MRLITPPSRDSGFAMSMRSRSCSHRCSGCVPGPDWSGSGWSRSTARRSRRRRPITRRAANEEIAREILEQAAELDAAEDELHGDARGDELPVELRVAGDRRKRLREAKQALDAEREADAEPVGRDRGERLRECRRRLAQDFELERRLVAEHDAWLEAGIASDGSRRMTGARHNLKPYPLTPLAERRINVTDPDSRNLKTTRGWVQGYNAQAVVTGEQIVLAAEISTESLDTANLRPMITAVEEELHAAGVTVVWTSCSPTPATGPTARSKRSPPRACNHSSPR